MGEKLYPSLQHHPVGLDILYRCTIKRNKLF